MDTDWRTIVADTWRMGQRLSAVGPGDVERHFTLSEQLVAGLPTPALVIDIGTGAGIPGLALAGLWLETQVHMVDAAARRVGAVQAGIDRLGWGSRVTVAHTRAEELGRDPAFRGRADLVVARSFGPPAVVAECGAGLLRLGGELVVSEPPDGGDERWPAAGLAELGLTRIDEPPSDPRRQRLRLDQPVSDRYPRRPGMPTKRPLF